MLQILHGKIITFHVRHNSNFALLKYNGNEHKQFQLKNWINNKQFPTIIYKNCFLEKSRK